MIQITNTLKTGETKLPELRAKTRPPKFSLYQWVSNLFKTRDRKLGRVRMFVCGPTVYDYTHIGNARTFVVFDVIAKYLRYRGYDLNYIQNITDIDDRIIKRAQETGQNWKELSEKFEKIFLENMKSLKVDSVDEYPRATDHIPEIIKQVKTLIEKGNAYLIEGDPVKSPDGDNGVKPHGGGALRGAGGYYFDLKTFPEYGKLSGRTTEMAEDAVSRIDEGSKKRNRGDFCLWKLAPHRSEASGAGFSKEDEPSWESELGAGRPGWHIEDTAITEKYFGPQYEIHGGGQDLIFPHHEAEIAQQESASGLKPFVRFWLHAGFIVQKGEKMSKSRGVFLTVENALKKYSPEALRFYFLSAHYRSPLDYTEDSLKAAEAATNRAAETKEKLKNIKKRDEATERHAKDIADSLLSIENWRKSFQEAMDDDFNTPLATGSLFSLLGKVNYLFSVGSIGFDTAKQLSKFFEEVDEILGIIPPKVLSLPSEVSSLRDERERARQQEDFARADRLREQIKNLGYKVEDTAYGPLVEKIK